jgi:hypothetical protein
VAEGEGDDLALDQRGELVGHARTATLHISALIWLQISLETALFTIGILV